ncbi:MAG: isopentenyl-diphosphate Delta-isomerase [Candidatus Onthomonas sp.]
MSDELILVDIFDQPVGTASKEECHRRGLLHRAFSVFLYRDGRMAIQQRAMDKYHSGGLWSNSCCSHPRPGESLPQAVQRRLGEELGLSCLCEELFSFVYHHRFREDLFEYEFDHVYLGKYEGEIVLNPQEAIDLRWVPFAELAEDLRANPQRYSVWFLTAAPKVLAYLMEKSV